MILLKETLGIKAYINISPWNRRKTYHNLIDYPKHYVNIQSLSRNESKSSKTTVTPPYRVSHQRRQVRYPLRDTMHTCKYEEKYEALIAGMVLAL